jgi:glucuronate isomerase
MKAFFSDEVLLSTPAAVALYEGVKDLPIIDYHCHLNEREIQNDYRFSELGELWLGGDHYKWRAMRLCGVDEKYITGDASYTEKYRKYAEIFPRLCGNPLYYWTQMELKILFGITEPLCAESADRILEAANKQLKSMTVRDILQKFKVEYIATTDDATAALDAHGDYGNTQVRPTFRPDKLLSMDAEELGKLETVCNTKIDTLDDLKSALAARVAYFRSKDCRIADHGMDFLPLPDCGETVASELFARRNTLTDTEKRQLSSHLLCYLASLYTKEDMVMQLHFATYRCVNSAMLPVTGRDSGFDIMRGEVDTDALVVFLDTLQSRNALPKTVLYTLNPSVAPALATLSGAFRNVRVGAAWWFNDTVLGIRKQLETVAEYAALGTNLGMLTDSRSFASYARFDFFRRILADLVGGYVERGEYDPELAKSLMEQVCYTNIKEFLKL